MWAFPCSLKYFTTNSKTSTSITAAEAQERYLHSDHLGSIVAVTDNQGRILERFSYDAWGKRRNLDGSDDQVFDNQGLGILPSLSTHHGFTGHEMLDDMTLVHMNGRLYDPIIARFISADPHIDGLYSTQGLNSYSYVHNNPLNAIDPSGYFLKKVFKGVKKALSGLNKIRKSVQNALNRPFYQVIRALGPVAQPLVAIGSIMACKGAAPQCYAAVMGGGSFAVAHANGASTSQALRIGAISGATAYVGAHAADWIGSYTADLQFAPKLTNVSLHGLRGGVTSVVSGGDFRSGFLAGSFGAFGDVNGLTRSQYGAAIVGGIGAKLGGGSFAEGAIIAIIGRRFNHEEHEDALSQLSKEFSNSLDEAYSLGKAGNVKEYLRRVGNGGTWDFKSRHEFRLMGDIEAFGNFAFGATSAAWADGFTRGVSRFFSTITTNFAMRGAGYYQQYYQRYNPSNGRWNDWAPPAR